MITQIIFMQDGKVYFHKTMMIYKSKPTKIKFLKAIAKKSTLKESNES